MDYKNLDDLLDSVQSAINNTLENEVFEEVKETELRHIRTDVYEVYKPSIYERRYSREGMLDANNIVILDDNGNNSVTNGNLSVVNVTPPNPYARDGATTSKDLPELIEYGDENYLDKYPFATGYDYPGEPYGLPRPFTANTIDELQTTKAHIVALKKGLLSKGFDID